MWSLRWKSCFAGPTSGFFYDMLLGAVSIGLVSSVRTFCRYLDYSELAATLSNQGNCWNILGQPVFQVANENLRLKEELQREEHVDAYFLSPYLLPLLKSRAIDTLSA